MDCGGTGGIVSLRRISRAGGVIAWANWARLAGSAQNGQGTECCANERLCDRKLPGQDQSHALCKIRLPIISQRQPSFASVFAVCSKLWPKISRPCTRARFVRRRHLVGGGRRLRGPALVA